MSSRIIANSSIVGQQRQREQTIGQQRQREQRKLPRENPFSQLSGTLPRLIVTRVPVSNDTTQQ